jgi:TRAP-type C4-dicarboxylate transport system permease small subunit
MNKLLARFAKLASGLSKVSGMLILLISVLVCTHVILRGILGSGLRGIYEIVQYGMLTVVSITLAENELTGGSIIVNFILDKMRPRVANVFSIGMYAIAAGSMSYVLYNQVRMVLQKYADGSVTGVLAIPHWILVAIVCIGLFFFILAFIARLAQMVQNHASLRDEALTSDEIAAEMKARSEF